MAASDERMAQLVAQLRAAPDLTGTLPGDEAAIVAAALGGASVHAIAHDRAISTEAVWAALGNAARLARGDGVAPRTETGGLGSDPSPGEDEPTGAPGTDPAR